MPQSMGGKAKLKFAVACDKHGTHGKNNIWATKMVAVGQPKGRDEQKHGGCPVCKREAP